MKRKPDIRVVQSATRARYVRIQRLKPLGLAHSIVSVQLADPDGVAVYSTARPRLRAWHLVVIALAAAAAWSLVSLTPTDIASIQCRHTSAQPSKC